MLTCVRCSRCTGRMLRPPALQELLETAGACLEPLLVQGGASSCTNGSGGSSNTVPLLVGRYRQVVSHMLKANLG